ncbi:MAG: terpene cyclase/mutase family protein [Planctomycetes bacterium]|nr:terpene cyclase/mutase family protein [Planctomycetota bacterium]
MSRFLLVAGFLSALGCARKEAPPVVVNEPAPVIVEPHAAPDDGNIPPPRPVAVRSRAEALTLGCDYLLAQQSSDGAWRSDVYATFKDGTALTPLALTALQEAHDAGVRTPAIDATIKKGCAFLATFTKDGTVKPPADGFDYPLYTATLTLKAFSHPTAADFAKHRAVWVKYLKERQLTEKLGWKPQEKEYGGWGYCRVIPQKPEPGTFAPNLIESNLSATLFALDALRAAGETDAEVYRAAAVFVRRCQNADGGFHFIYDDPTRNKAGVANTDPPTFHSYGSTTADGLRALALCGDPTDKDRLDAARKWLVENYRTDHHPGTYTAAYEPNRDAVYFYYAASLSKAFRDHDPPPEYGRSWSTELGSALATRQAKDGSWTNPVELVRENDPIVATCSAVLALARCDRSK